VPGDLTSLYRARTAREKGTVEKDWGGRCSVALVYPNAYHLGMSNLGFQVVYGLLNDRPDTVAERVFLPEGQEMSLHLRRGTPLFSLESRRPLRDFDLIAFSLSFENDYPNILKILEMGRIRLLERERREAPPFVMAGGVTTFLNPEPLAPFMDFFLLGEAEANLNEFMDRFTTADSVSADKEEFKLFLARNISSLYVPSLYRVRYRRDGTIGSCRPLKAGVPEKVRSAVSRPGEFAAGPVACSTLTTPDTEFGDRVLIELGRGCGRSCRFCAAGYVYRPPRIHEESRLLSAVGAALEGCPQVGLLSAAVTDIPGIERIASAIVQRGNRFSVSSLRADSLTEGLLVSLREAGQKTIAIAPEAGSERLRRTINKHLSREQIHEAVTRIADTGDFSIRLYFLVGLPTETDDDIGAIVDMLKSMKHHMVKSSAGRGSIGQIRLSVNCFVPKPFTPFQWFPMASVSSLKQKQRRLKKALSREGGVKVSFDLPKWAYVQTLLAMGDRRTGDMLLKAHQLGGNWWKAFPHMEINPDFFVHRPRGIDERLPWDVIDHGIDKAYLAKEYKLALKERESEICLVGECTRCGVCAGIEH